MFILVKLINSRRPGPSPVCHSLRDSVLLQPGKVQREPLEIPIQTMLQGLDGTPGRAVRLPGLGAAAGDAPGVASSQAAFFGAGAR